MCIRGPKLQQRFDGPLNERGTSTVNGHERPKEPRACRCFLFALTAAVGLSATVTGGCTNRPASENATAASPTGATEAAAPSSQTLLAIGPDSQDWLLAGHGYDNNRFVSSTITKSNVATLAPAWSTQIADDGEQEAAPVVWNGTMYLSTPHNHVIALNAATGALKWDSPYTPATILDFAVNRGVGIVDGKVFIATQDCRIRALDAQTGHQVWSVAGCSTQQNNWYSMPVYVYKDKLLVGVAGGDFGANGSVQAFSAKDGTKLWQWDTVPGPGQPGHETWPGDSWKHGGAALWEGCRSIREPTPCS